MNKLKFDSFWLNSFENNSESTAFIWRNSEFKYGYLKQSIIDWIQKLEAIEEGSVVGVESDFTPQTISLLFALIEKKCIIVPLDYLSAEKNKKKFEIAQIKYLFRLKDDFSLEFQQLETDKKKHDLYEIIFKRGNSGLILFTSGSSGEPKAALHDFSNLLEKFKVKRSAFKTVNFLLFDHWGGLNTLFHILSNSGCVVILEKRTPDYVCEIIERYKVELLPTSPTFLNLLLLSRAYTRYNLSSIKIISYGAEPMPNALLQKLVSVFPNIKFQQTYGLIELGVMRSKSESNDSLWVKIGGEGYQIRVNDGLLEIKAESAMLGYLNAVSPFTEDGWFKTGDSVEIKGDYFRILGRKSELINVGGEKVYPQEVENVILSFANISDVVVYSEKSSLVGNIVCAKINLIEKVADNKQFIKDLKTHCRENLASFKIPVKFIIEEQQLFSQRFKKIRNNG